MQKFQTASPRFQPLGRRAAAAALLLLVGAALGACDRDKSKPASEDKLTAEQPNMASSEGTASGAENQPSIMRPEVEAEREQPPQEPLEQSVSFAESGSRLSDQAKSELDTILQSPQAKEGGPVTLRGHSDSAGDDEDNLAISRKRAEAVRDYLVMGGVAPGRIRVIALGETRPVAPNATLDGEPDEAGMAKNRRVDIEIALPAEQQEQTAQ